MRLLMITMAAALAAGAGAGTTGPANGGFEEGTADLPGWRFWSRSGEGSAEPSTDAHGGKRAARIRHSGELDWAFTNSARIAVRPGQTVRASAWVKGSGGVELAVVAFAGDKRITWSAGADSTRAGTRWVELRAAALVPDGCDNVQLRFVGRGDADVLLDDLRIEEIAAATRPAKPAVKGYAEQRVSENLDRGLVVLPTTAAGAKAHYLSWRLLDGDPSDAAFHVYRTSGGRTERLTAQAITATTDFVDKGAPAQVRYFVRRVAGGVEGEACRPVAPATQPWLSVKFRGDYEIHKLAIADLDGDGRLDYVIQQPRVNVDPYGPYWKKSPGTYKLEAYSHDGEFLWSFDRGWSIEQGVWYAPYVVYDLDGDGRAEVALKAGEGDPRDADGRVQAGPEYLLILDGRTGAVRARADWPDRTRFPDYNYWCRNQLGIAYLDGKTPCLIVERGTYNTIKVEAWEFHNGALRKLWSWNDRDEPRGGYRGQGAHCLRAADVDGDGRDEVIIGSAVIDDNGVGLWTTREGHPDAVTVGDLDPARPGLEIQYNLEPKHERNGMCMVDARTGALLWGLDEPTTHVHSQGLCADIDPENPGCEAYGGERDFKEKRWLFSAAGKLLSREDLGGLAPKAAYWDADPWRELIWKNRPVKFRGRQAVSEAFEGTLVAVADIIGDWREEVITCLPGELRIYSTTIPAADRRVCLLRDPIYRLDVATMSQGYYQIPALSVLPSAGSVRPSGR